MTPPPEGFSLIQNNVSIETWTSLQHWIETNDLDGENCPIPWQIGAQNRQVAQYGFRYDYENDVVDTTTSTPPIPPKLKKKLKIDDIYTQCIINRYEPNILIPWHTDDSSFGPTIVVFSFGEERPLMLRREEEEFQAIPKHGSKYVLSGSARYEWEHMVPAGSGIRISFTFRTHKDGIF